MSSTVDFFFNHSESLPELAKSINAWLGCVLSPYEGDSEDLYCRFLGMEFSLSGHDLENDGECRFKDYQFQLGFRIPAPDGDLSELPIPNIAMVIYVLFSRMKISGILVCDVQIPLAQYEARNISENSQDALYDGISNEIISFPKHFATLQERISKSHS